MEHSSIDRCHLLAAYKNEPDNTSFPASECTHDEDYIPLASFSFSWRKFWAFTGPGWLMSMAYLDPGNLEADLQSGAYTKYALLYTVLLSTVVGGCYQILAARLGTCTGRHLAQICRSEYPPIVSIALWLMTELAIIGSDIQEVLGSAIAFQILFHFPLWLGCVLTGLDTFTFLAIHRNSRSNGSRTLEIFFMMLISIMCICFFADFTVSAPDGWAILQGVFVPSLKEQNVMQAVATLGAIIMPHNLFLHSALVQVRGINPKHIRRVQEANMYFSIEAIVALGVSFCINAAVVCVFASSFYSSQCASLSDKTTPSSLARMGIQTTCVPIQTALSSGSPIYDAYSGNQCFFNLTSGPIVHGCSMCYVDHHSTMSGPSTAEYTAGYCQEIGLGEAGAAIHEALGGYAKVIWAIGLLASGQASTMTGTYAGQFVMEGFLNLKIAAWKRVTLTRAVALVPAISVAVLSQHASYRSDHWNELLNVLQSIQLPFALLPLLSFTSNRQLMGDRFVTSKWISNLLMLGTMLLCGLNYGLVYKIFLSILTTIGLSLYVWLVMIVLAIMYVALILYLIAQSSTLWGV